MAQEGEVSGGGVQVAREDEPAVVVVEQGGVDPVGEGVVAREDEPAVVEQGGAGPLALVISGHGAAAQEREYPTPIHSHEDVVRDKALFMDSLRYFHSFMGTKFLIPVIGKKQLNLHMLYVEVTARGGLEKVMETKRWKEIITLFQLPPTITSASYVLRKYYLSLLYHYEQVYFFRTRGPPVPPADSLLTKTPVGARAENRLVASDSTMQRERIRKGKRPLIPDETPCAQEAMAVDNHGPYNFTVTGSIDAKFDFGYMVTVMMGAEKLRGVLYHMDQQPPLPLPAPPAAAAAATVPVTTLAVAQPPAAGDGAVRVQRRVGRRPMKFRRTRAPGHPKPNRSAYNFFFSDKHGQLKAEFPNRDIEYSKLIGESWSKLTEDERKVYNEKAQNDKERYRRELAEFKAKNEASTSTAGQKKP